MGLSKKVRWPPTTPDSFSSAGFVTPGVPGCKVENISCCIERV